MYIELKFIKDIRQRFHFVSLSNHQRCPLFTYYPGIHGNRNPVCYQLLLFWLDISREIWAYIPLHWRHNAHDRISNHQPHDCLLKRLFRRRSKKTSKLRVTGVCAGNSPGTGQFPAQMPSYAENVSIWWRHHAIWFWQVQSNFIIAHSTDTDQKDALYLYNECLFRKYLRLLWYITSTLYRVSTSAAWPGVSFSSV